MVTTRRMGPRVRGDDGRKHRSVMVTGSTAARPEVTTHGASEAASRSQP